jgi:hypothetical protein
MDDSDFEHRVSPIDETAQNTRDMVNSTAEIERASMRIEGLLAEHQEHWVSWTAWASNHLERLQTIANLLGQIRWILIGLGLILLFGRH